MGTVDLATLIVMLCFLVSLVLSLWNMRQKFPFADRFLPAILQVFILVLALIPSLHGHPTELFLPMIFTLLWAVFAIASAYRLYHIGVRASQLLGISQFIESVGGGSLLAMNADLSASSIQAVPLTKPADGSGDAVPLSLYPPGFDLSNFLIFDPTSSQWVSGASYSAAMNANGVTLGGPIPLDGGGGGSTNTATPGTGFYRVVRDGVHIFGLTNGAVLSGTVQFPIEIGLDDTDEVVGVVFYDEDNNPIIGATGDGGGDHWALNWNTLATENGTYNRHNGLGVPKCSVDFLMTGCVLILCTTV